MHRIISCSHRNMSTKEPGALPRTNVFEIYVFFPGVIQPVNTAGKGKEKGEIRKDIDSTGRTKIRFHDSLYP